MPSIKIADAQNVCRAGRGAIGSDYDREYDAEVRVGGRLYLNTDNPAQCNGSITQLEYCYYPPDNPQRIYSVDIAIYREQFNRRQQRVYQLQIYIPISLSGFLLNDEFSCATLNIPSTIAIYIQEGDIIGACLPGINSLDVVNDTSISTEENLNASLSYIESNCLASPQIIDNLDTRIQESRILHVFARITSKILL